MSNDTQFDRWRAALKGAKLDLGERGNPPSGFYRMKRWRNDPPPPFQRTLALWRDADQILAEINFKFRDLAPDVADELFANPDLVAVPHSLYELARAGEPWPDVHTTYLRTKDITAGVVWTEEWSRKQLASQVETHDEHGERREVSPLDALSNSNTAAIAALGHNGPPRDGVEQIKDRLQTVAEDITKSLKVWGGKPRDKAEADRCGDFINAMRAIYKDADSRREEEKAPSLAAGREIDAKWKPVKDEAERMAKKLKGIASEWLEAEQKKANEAAATERAKLVEASPSAEHVPTVETPKISIGTGRQISIKVREMYQVTDPKMFFDHLFEKGIVMSDIMIEAHKLANKLAANGLPVPGVDRIQQRKAS